MNSGGHEQSKSWSNQALDNKKSNRNPWIWRWCSNWIYIQPVGSEGNDFAVWLISVLVNVLHNALETETSCGKQLMKLGGNVVTMYICE